jgi:hypothetical protein
MRCGTEQKRLADGCNERGTNGLRPLAKHREPLRMGTKGGRQK